MWSRYKQDASGRYREAVVNTGLTVCCNFLCTHSMYLFNLSNPGTSLIIKIALVNFHGKSDCTRKWHICVQHTSHLNWDLRVQFKARAPIYSRKGLK